MNLTVRQASPALKLFFFFSHAREHVVRAADTGLIEMSFFARARRSC